MRRNQRIQKPKNFWKRRRRRIKKHENIFSPTIFFAYYINSPLNTCDKQFRSIYIHKLSFFFQNVFIYAIYVEWIRRKGKQRKNINIDDTTSTYIHTHRARANKHFIILWYMQQMKYWTISRGFLSRPENKQRWNDTNGNVENERVRKWANIYRCFFTYVFIWCVKIYTDTHTYGTKGILYYICGCLNELWIKHLVYHFGQLFLTHSQCERKLWHF